MAYLGSDVGREALRARIVSAQAYVAEMVAERTDGEVYLPIFVRLEAELAALEAKETAIERAKRLVMSKQG
ncbi:hypothetical protein ATO6_23240 [Oceanicola sp. 22II-s10i]|nr:hypothetical protein ATO6_23240 [Oceanicola sp. 22II-s10i]